MQSRRNKKNMSYVNVLTRNEKADYLTTLVNQRKLTQDGKEWLVAALDPFHDYSHQISGYPDADVSQTVVSCYQYELNIRAPELLPEANTWDCHIYSLPMANSFSAAPANVESDTWEKITSPSPSADTALGPITVFTAFSGSPLGPSIPKNTDSRTFCVPEGGVEDLSSGCSRIIAGGFEVHNTTAEIYKQGSVTTYRMPQAGNENQVLYTNADHSALGTIFGKRFRAPPLTIGQANLLKGTRTWEAKDGVYATLFQSTVTNPLKQVSNLHLLFDPYADPGLEATVQCTPVTLDSTNAYVTPKANQAIPFDTTGAFFMGLSSQTTLTLKARFYVERAPTWNEAQLAVLASPSAGYDLIALQLYAQVINMLPPAVMVGENAKGDWWRAIVSVLKHVSGPLGLALSPFVPGAGLVGQLVGNMAGQVDTEKPIGPQVVQQAKRIRPRLISAKKETKKTTKT